MADVKKVVKGESLPIEPQQINPEFVAFFENVYDRWIANLFELSDGLSRFAKDRIQRDMSAWVKLVSCRDPKDLLACQKDLAEEMTTRFADDVLAISNMIATVAGHSHSPAHGNGGGKS